jgi:hypothetical protein
MGDGPSLRVQSKLMTTSFLEQLVCITGCCMEDLSYAHLRGRCTSVFREG